MPNATFESPTVLMDREHRRDRFIRRVCIAAWSVTFVLVLLLGGVFAVGLAHMWRLVQVGGAGWLMVLGVAEPFIIVLGVISVLIATLATVGMFMRSRTASLVEIQYRLAALEQMLATRGDAE
jgi:hypothetical protein